MLRYPTLQSKLEALDMPGHCTPHVFYCCCVQLIFANMKIIKKIIIYISVVICAQLLLIPIAAVIDNGGNIDNFDLLCLILFELLVLLVIAPVCVMDDV